MKINSMQPRSAPLHEHGDQTKTKGASFSELLRQTASASPQGSGDQAGQAEPIRLGTITARTPTVSDLLHSHPEYKGRTWKIIHLKGNQHLPYRSIRAGTDVFLDPKTLSLTWQDRHATGVPSPSPAPLSATYNPTATPSQEKVSLGTISSTAPTISHLLRCSPRFQKQTWNIVFARCNRDKPFSSLRPGTEIFLNPETRELSWATDDPAPSSLAAQRDRRQAPALPPRPKDVGHDLLHPPPQELVEAIKPYLGRPYREIDCYNLVVRGLTRMGITYQGDGGVRDRLVQRAVQQGLPSNAYMNGEGLIAVTGRRLYSKTLLHVANPRTEGKQLLEEMAPSLAVGCILSFSTPTKGHTGVISRKGDTWTFINSGEMDNAIDGGANTRRVGEEILEKEVENWLQRARRHNQSLLVTLGKPEDIRTAMEPPPPATSRAL